MRTVLLKNAVVEAGPGKRLHIVELELVSREASLVYQLGVLGHVVETEGSVFNAVKRGEGRNKGSTCGGEMC